MRQSHAMVLVLVMRLSLGCDGGSEPSSLEVDVTTGADSTSGGLPCPVGPGFLLENDQGRCTILSCPPGQHPNPGGVTCIFDCPKGFEEQPSDGGLVECLLPCLSPMERTPDGTCTLPCGDGMVSTHDTDHPSGCLIKDLGPDFHCDPNQEWPDTTGLKNPVFVKAGSTAVGADGSKDAPYHNLDYALQKHPEDLTLVVSPGIYTEQITITDRNYFGIVGTCAGNTLLSPGTLNDLECQGAYYGAVVSLCDVRDVLIRDIGIDSPMNGLLALAPGQGDRIEVSGVDVDAPKSGLMILDRYQQVIMSDNRVAGFGQTGIGYSAYLPNPPHDANTGVWFSGNEVVDSSPCDGHIWCGDDSAPEGITINASDPVFVTGNRVAHLDGVSCGLGAMGPIKQLNGNIVEDIIGVFSVDLFIQNVSTTEISGNRIVGGRFAEVSGSSSVMFCGMNILSDDTGVAVTAEGNALGDIQGFGMSHSSNTPGQFDVLASDFKDTTTALTLEGLGPYRVDGCSFLETRYPLRVYSFNKTMAKAVTILHNDFGPTRTDSFGFEHGSSSWEAISALEYGVLISTDSENGTMEFRGNRVTAQAVLVPDQGAATAFFGGMELTIADNLMADNSAAWLIRTESVLQTLVEGNRVIGRGDAPPGLANFGGWYFQLEMERDIESVVMRGNVVENFPAAHHISVFIQMTRAAQSLTFEDNRFIDANVVGMGSFSTADNPDVSWIRNDFVHTTLGHGSADLFTLENNRFMNSYARLQSHPEVDADEVTEVTGNLFQQGWIALYDQYGMSLVEGNRFENAMGFGIHVASPHGEVVIRDNQIDGVRSGKVGPEGADGDAIQITSSAIIEDASFRVESNTIIGPDRYGVVIHGVGGIIQDNDIRNVGGGAEGTCDLVIQFEPADHPVTGSDLSTGDGPCRPAEAPVPVMFLDDVPSHI